MDCRSFPDLFRKRAVVFTDTADFTVRTARDGILQSASASATASAAATSWTSTRTCSASR
jgi:hypothetical protein